MLWNNGSDPRVGSKKYNKGRQGFWAQWIGPPSFAHPVFITEGFPKTSHCGQVGLVARRVAQTSSTASVSCFVQIN